MEQRQALAGFALSVALFALALPIPPREAKPCRFPEEAQAVEQHTVAVRCGPLGAQTGEIRGPARRLFGLPIELNCAGARTLETLEGIGSVRAQQIVDERAREPFERVDDLLRVHGIGPKTLAGLRSAVTANACLEGSDPTGSPACPAAAAAGGCAGARGSAGRSECRCGAVRESPLGRGGRL